jgi:histidinol-phosphate aminotransferase
MSERHDPNTPAVPEAIHGGPDESLLRRFGLCYEEVTDFSSSINPYGPSPQVIAAVRSHDFSRYPDREATALRRSISAELGIPREAILVGCGSSELLHFLSLALLDSDSTCLVAGPTYGEYERVARLRGARVIEVRADERNRFAFPELEWEYTLRAERPDLVFLCRPNNPTGVSVAFDRVRDWLREFQQTCFVIDEAYLPFAEHERSFAADALDRDNLVVLHSLTKLHALAGLRLGYAVAGPALIERMQRFRIPWNVSSAAQIAGIAALEDRPFAEASLSRIAASQSILLAEVRTLGWECVAAVSAFLLLKVPDAGEVQTQLLRHRLLVRDCRSFGLPDWVRISTRREEENRLLLDRLARGHSLGHGP